MYVFICVFICVFAVNLAVVYQFCKLINLKISDPRLGTRMCSYYAESDGPRRTNAAFLLGKCRQGSFDM